MTPTNGTEIPGRLAENIAHFARALRAAGLPVGPASVIDAVEGVTAAGIGSREDFYWILHCYFVRRREHHGIFDQAFHIFWRNPHLLERMMEMLLPTLEVPEENLKKRSANRRVAEALLAGGDNKRTTQPPEIEVDAVQTSSDQDILKKRDFEQMSTEELERTKAIIARLTLPFDKVKTRRTRPSDRGQKIDMRATLRACLRTGGQVIPLKRRAPVYRHPPLVVLCDISGSMSRYSRMFLHFLHAITNDRDRVHSFAFGTRLTNITRALARRDVDDALEQVSGAVVDWEGGTRIGATLHEFNRLWSRRVLGQGAVVLLITDGLDRDAGEGLEPEIIRLHKSCRHLIWLNPLLRFDGFEPKSLGIKALLPHVDDFRPVHNLESLADLAHVLTKGPIGRVKNSKGLAA